MNLDTIKIQKVTNEPFQEFLLLKAKKSKASKVIEKIKVLLFSILKSFSIKLKCQDYLYHNIHLFV